MATPALLALIKTFADGGKDAVAASHDTVLSDKIAEFENLISDALDDVRAAPDLKSEIDNFQPADAANLVAALVDDCGFTNPHAQAIAAAVVKFVQDATNESTGVVVDLLALLHVIKYAPATN